MINTPRNRARSLTQLTQAEALAHLLPARRRRSYPRLTHTSTAKRRAARTTPPGPTTYKTTIITSAHATGLPGP